ncbi:MAG TPA: adenylate kinase family protein [archaeon]|nr:adenylate kinase family protein [archaeon]
MIVTISGVGGVGKTTVTKLLVKKLKWRLVRPDDIAKKKKLYAGFDKERKSWIVNLEKLGKELRKIEKKEKNVLVESLYAHFFEADIVIVLRCRPEVLEKRLKKKYDWPTKIVENKEAEMIGVITQEAVERHGRSKVYELDTTRATPMQTVGQMMEIIKGGGKKYKAGRIDWLK